MNDAAAGKVFNLYMPRPLLIVPFSLFHPMFNPDEPFEAVMFYEGIKVSADLFTRGIDTGEIRIRLETIGIIMGREVARNPEQIRAVSDIQLRLQETVYPG